MTPELLRISADIGLPREVVTQTLAIIATKGSGKSYASAVLAEEFMAQALPFAIIDPLGVYWGLRSSADGLKPGYSIAILGGEFADVRIKPTHGKGIATWLVNERFPVVIDLSEFRRDDATKFMLAFASELFHLNRDPLHLIVDEADLFMSQKPGPNEHALLGAFEDIVRRGRARGIGMTMITQRPAVINKNVLTQISTLLTLRIGGPQDRDAIKEWIRFHGEKSDQLRVLESLAGLPIGTGWLWSPGWLQTLKKIRVRRRLTWDSSATPKVGEARKLPTARANPRLGTLGKSAVKSDDYREKVREVRALMPRLTDDVIAALEQVTATGLAADYLTDLVKWYRALPVEEFNESSE